MAYGNKILTSLVGRRLGLQRLTTGESGGSRGSKEFLVGPDGFRDDVTTGETTATNLTPYGVSHLPGTSAASSAVYTIDPPIPGIRKLISGATDNGPVYLKTAGGETILTSAGSTFNTVKISSLGGAFELIGLTTARWLTNLVTGTSSQASGFGLTTST